jgi:large subunit ribosomal protein L9
VKVILREHVANLGEMGAMVNVADGYARNYLIPRRLAVQSDSASAQQVDHELRIIGKREEEVRAKLQDVAKQLEALTVEITARAGEGDKLFGSVTNGQISEKLHELGHEVDRRTIVIEEPIRTLGIHEVPVKLGSGVEASVKVWVSKDEPEGQSLEEAAVAAVEAIEAEEAAVAAAAEKADTETQPEPTE